MRSDATARTIGLVLALLAASVAPAGAHLGNLCYTEIVARGAEVDVQLRFAAHMIPGTGPAAAGKLTRRDVVAREGEVADWLGNGVRVEMGGARCKSELVDSMGPDTNDDLTIVLHYVCLAAADALRVEFHAFDEMMPEYQNIASVRTAGGATSFVFTAASPVLVVGAATRGGSAGGAAGSGASASAGGLYGSFLLGVEHMVTGYDHLLYLLALLIAGGNIGRLAGIVTAFTVAQGITASLALLGVVSPPALPLEVALAAGVLLAAALAVRMTAGVGRDHRALLTFAYGLAHGFGFAALVGVPSAPVAFGALLSALSVGVEAGQLALVIVGAPLVALLARALAGRRLLRALAWTVLAVATFFFAERLAALLYP